MTDSGTSDEHGSGIIPGWYADPYDPNQLRWWDGTQWSDQVSALQAIPLPSETPATTAPTAATPASAPAVVEPPVVEPSAVEPLPSRRALRESRTSYRAPERSVAPHDPTPVTEPAVGPAAGLASDVVPEPAAEPAAEPVEEPHVAPIDPLDIFTTPDRLAEEPEIGAPAPGAAPASAQSAWDIPATTESAWDVPATTDDPAIPLDETAAGPPAVDWGLSPRSRRSEAPTAADGSFSVWVWLIAFSPIIAALTVGYALATADSGSVSWMLPAALVVPYLLVLLFAVADRSGLTAQGRENTVPWTWAALTAPVYLVVRSGVLRRENGRSLAPLIAWIVFFVVAIVGFLGYGLVSGHPLLAGLPG
jgi:hypothetical protein